MTRRALLGRPGAARRARRGRGGGRARPRRRRSGCRAVRRRAGSSPGRGSRGRRSRARSARGRSATPRRGGPRRASRGGAGSRGEPRLKPSGASQSSCSATISSHRAVAFSYRRSTPASAVSATPDSTAARSRIGGVPAWKRADAVDRVVGALHRELVALAEPAPDRRAQLRLELARHVQERRRSRPGVEVLVGAADGQLDAAPAQVDRDRAGRMAEVPDHAGAVRARRRGQRPACRRSRRSGSRRGERARPRRRRAPPSHRRPAAARRRAAPPGPRARSGRSGSCRAW